MNEFISIVPIREGSKGIKNKNLVDIQGIPLYLRTVNQALRITQKCIVNTDIKDVLIKKFDKNIITFKREKKFAQDNTPMNIVLKDLFSKINLDNKIILLLQATSPLREDMDIKNAIEIYKKNNFQMVLSAKKVNSIFLKYGYQHNKNLIPFHKKYIFKNRQSLPNVYAPNGALYIFSGKDFLKKNKIPENNIGFYEMSKENSIDIDNKNDLDKVREILKHRQKNLD